MQLICVDEQSFKELRARGGIYVDKTKHIYDIFKDGKYFFIARPRRFGKSLLCSTLAELFANNRELFKNTWIDQSDWEWQEHPVIRLDMTKAAGAEATAALVRQRLTDLLNRIANEHSIAITETAGPVGMIQQLIFALYKKTGKGVVVIIDEYDKPLLDTIDDPSRYQNIHRELAAVYGQLKACSEQLRLVFLTGVFKFAQTSIFSGLNNITDLTFLPSAGTILGYTEQEIRTYFAEYLAALAKLYNLSVDETMSKLQVQYNGYSFGFNLATEQLAQSVYNPFAINHVFHQQQMIDQWFVSGTPTALIKKLQEAEFAALDQNNLVVEFNTLKASCEPDKMTALSMLYYAGYLTVKSYHDGELVLDFPNVEVGQAMSKLLLPLITKTPESNVREATKALKKVLVSGDLAKLRDLLNHILAQIPYGLHGNKPQEHYYQTVFHLLLAAAGFVVTPEDMTNRGRIDLTVIMPPVVYLFELKMDQPAAVAIQQIKALDYATKYRTPNRTIFAIGIAMSSKDRTVEELLFEEI